jgi:trehalose 6-phosphate synthase
MEEYRVYDQEVRYAIEHINYQYGEPDWQPVVAIYGHDRARALACLRNYDVLLINPVIDGLNLVAKEGGLLNERDGCMVLSRTAGVHDLIQNHVLSISPFDVGATADAIYAALCMSESERKQRAFALRKLLVAEGEQAWLTDILREMPAPTTEGV